MTQLVAANVTDTEARAPERDAKGRITPGHTLHRKGYEAPGRARHGNLAAVKNPWAVYWRRRALRPEDRWALPLVANYVEELVAQKGGSDNVTPAQQRVMELAAAARLCWALALAAGNPEATARFMGQERSCLTDLGLERAAKPVPNLADLLREAEAKHKAVIDIPAPVKEDSK